MTGRLRVGIFAGGRSAEHEVSVASADAVLRAIDRERFEPYLIYVDRDGRWHLPAGPAPELGETSLSTQLGIAAPDALPSLPAPRRPSDPAARGCQLSILVHQNPKEAFKKIEAAGAICDFREPNVIRAAPTPLYNTFHEIWRFAEILAPHR